MSGRRSGWWGVVGGVLAVGGVLGAISFGVSSRMPVVAVPGGVVPYPNAYGSYAGAAAGVVDAGGVRKASETASFSVDKKEKLVAANAGVLKRFRDATGYGCRVPLDADLNVQVKFGDLGCLLRLEGQVRAAKGDCGGAMGSLLDTVRFGEDMVNGGPLISRMIASNIENVGRRDAWGLVDKLDATEARAAANELEAIRGRHIPLAQVMRDTKWFFVDDVQAGRMPGPFVGNAGLSRTVGKFYVNTALQEVVVTLDAYADGVKRPYSATRYVGQPTHSEWAYMVRQSCDAVWFGDTCGRAQNALLNVSLAWRAYRAEHEKYPATLAELAPSYLKVVPGDPFAAGGQFGYRVGVGGGFVLYSVGPDGLDDAGRPVGGKAVNDRSLGDIVAGVDVEIEAQ